MANLNDGHTENHFPVHNFSKCRIIKNLIVLCIVFFVTFTAYDCLAMLQSTLNHDEGIGVVCQALVYGCFCLSSLIFPKYFIKRLGCKLSLTLSLCLYVPYILSNLYPHWSLMVPTSILNGLAAAVLWGSQSTYLNELSVMYADITLRNKDKSKNEKHCSTELSKKNIKTTVVSNDVDSNMRMVSVGHFKDSLQETGTGHAKDMSEGISKFVSNRELHPPQMVNLDGQPPHENSQRKLVEITTAKFFGLHGMAHLSTRVWSNLMSYLILQKDVVQYGNTTVLNSSCVCGAHFCNEASECFEHNLLTPSESSRTVLTAVCVSLGVIAVLTLLIFLDDLSDKNREVKLTFDLVLATSSQMKKTTQILLLPAVFYIGMMQGFYSGDFTASYVGCAWGTYHVALVSICYGGFCAVFSLLCGWLIKLTGRCPVFISGFLMNLAAQYLLLTWNPTAESPVEFFVIAGLWGASLGIFWSQFKAMYGVLFKDEEEAAFSAFHFWYSLGFCVSFAYSNHFCTNVKIYILMTVVVLGIIGYVLVETRTKIMPNKCTK